MPSMSPRTQQLQAGAGAGPDQETALFEKGFSDLAYNVLMNKLPDVVQDVVTFKILDTDIDKGMGIGAFVVIRHDQPLYIPVVLSDNNVKPIELLYHKALNIFLPLTKQWLEETDKSALSTMGKGVKSPETLYTDVDIRNIVVPPITGRFSYAAWEPVILADVAKVINLETLEKLASEPQLMLVDFLTKAPNGVKVAFTKALEKNAKLFKHAARIYGVSALSEALRPAVEKVAFTKEAAKQSFGGALWIADKDTTPTEFKRIFGNQAAEAYAGVRKKGFADKDDRLNRNMAVQEQPFTQWVEPNQPGVYILYGNAREEKPAMVMPNPIDLFDEGTRYGRRPAVGGHNPLKDNSYYDPEPFGTSNRVYPDGRPDEGDFAIARGYGAKKYLAVLANGSYLCTDKLVGRDSVADEVSGGPLHKRLFQDVAGAPKAGVGFFIRQRGTTFQATVPLEIKSITTSSEGVRSITATSPGGFGEARKIITEASHPYSTIWMPKGSNAVYLPPDFIWVPLKEKLKHGDFFTSAHDLAACASSAMSAVGARKVAIKNAGAGQFSIDGGYGLDRIPALRKLAYDFILPVDVAETLLAKVAAEHGISVWVASGEKLARAQLLLEKRGAEDDEKKKKKPDSGDKSKPKSKPPSGDGGGGADPNAGGDPSMGGDPMADPQAMAMMAAQAAPPPPSPSDLAAMEMQQQIEHEMLKLQEKQQMLMALTQRTQEIAGGAPVMPTVQSQAMGAPPPSTNLATGAPMGGAGMAGGMGGGMDPMGGGGMGGSNDPMGGGMPPSMGGGGMPGMPPGGDPMMGGAAPGGSLPMADAMSGMGGMGGMGGGGGMPPSMGGDPSMGSDPSMGGQQQGPPMAMMGPDGPSAQGLGGEINPQFMGQAAQLQSDDIFDAAAVSSLAQSPAVKELVGQYLPNLEKALDNLARVLLTLWMQEPDLKAEIGDVAFADLEDNLRSTFKSLGDLVLKLSQGAHAIKGQYEHANA